MDSYLRKLLAVILMIILFAGCMPHNNKPADVNGKPGETLRSTTAEIPKITDTTSGKGIFINL